MPVQKPKSKQQKASGEEDSSQAPVVNQPQLRVKSIADRVVNRDLYFEHFNKQNNQSRFF